MLEIYALSDTVLKRDGVPVRGLVSQKKAEALLVYLASHPKPHSRRSLVYLLWPDYPEHRGRNNLSVLLSSLKKHVGEVVAANRDTVRMMSSAYWFDAQVFWSCSSVLEPPNRAHNKLATLTKAAALYRQDFLAGVHIAHADDFNTWLEHERRRFNSRAVAVLNALSDDHYYQGRYAEGIDVAQRVLVFDPLNDHAHERFIHMLALTDQRTKALRHFDNYCNLLADELQLIPNTTLQALVTQIRKGAFVKGAFVDAKGADAAYRTNAITTLQEPVHEASVDTHRDRVSRNIISVTPPANSPANSEEDEHIAPANIFMSLQGRPQPMPLPVHLPAPLQAPPPPRHFVGRSAEKRYVHEYLQQNAQLPVALVGMGGLGKSALISSLAQELRDDFTDGILWANASTTDPMTILATWAGAYGYDVSSLHDVESRASTLSRVLVGKRVLMILDDVTDAARVRTLLASQNTPALFTTRDLEVAHSLEATVVQLDTLARADSQQLLRHSIGDARVDAEPDATQHICALLDDLPLAIDITAKRLQSRTHMSLADMASRLRDSQQRMDLKIGDLAVRSSFDVSWRALNRDQQSAFCALAVFAGRTFDAAALAHVLTLPHTLAEDHLHSLYALSLVQEEGDIYYRQHPLLADFAQEKLEQTAANHDAVNPNATDSDVEHKLWARMVDHYHRVGQEAAPHLLGENQHEWLDKLATVYPNIRAAIAWAITHQKLELVESFLTNLERFWLIRGYLAEQLQLYQSLLDLSKTAHNSAALHYDYAYMLYRTGDYIGAQTQAVFAFDLATAQSDAKAIALARHMLGIMADETGDSELALEHYQASMAFFQAQEDDAVIKANMIKALFKDLYVAAANLGQDALAKHYCEQHYAIASEQGDQREISIALSHLGSIALEQADYPRAKDYFLASMTVRSRLQDKLGLADVHASLAWLALVEQRYQDAKTAADTAVQLCLAIGEQYVSLYAYSHLAVAEAELGHVAAAWQHFARALRVCRALGVKQEGLLCLERVAYYLTAHTQYAPEAARFLFSAEHIRTTSKLPRFKVEPSLTPTWQHLRTQLPKDVLHACEQQGRTLGFSDALDEADQLLRTLVNDSTSDDSTSDDSTHS